ncbi:MAG: hypothetical protein KIT17_09560 [Rubrivivax sp.]|nr:hypothetical protein [Rubrivivax sp.]
MPWDEWRYPVSMRRLAPVVRTKAIDIANALLAEGMDEGRAIRIAIAGAKAWARRHGLVAWSTGSAAEDPWAGLEER